MRRSVSPTEMGAGSGLGLKLEYLFSINIQFSSSLFIWCAL